MVDEIGGIPNPLVTKLSHFARLSGDDIRLLHSLSLKEEQFGADTTLVSEGEVPRSAFVLTRGLACRYRLLPDGRRQILTFLMPGDFCNIHAFLQRAMDHSVTTIVPSRIAAIPRERVSAIAARRPRLAEAIWWSEMQEAAMLRERIVALGRRNARGRVAYLLCELVWRQRAIGLSEDHAIRLPLTQPELGDTLGLTPVHINRVLQEFRREDLISLDQRRLALLDMGKLQEIAGFNKAYLHLEGVPDEVQRFLDGLERDSAGEAEVLGRR
jgi:CRP-like cAMP-binding protein